MGGTLEIGQVTLMYLLFFLANTILRLSISSFKEHNIILTN